jgi:hypothetical protein
VDVTKRLEKKKSESLERIEKSLANEYSCYVLITCSAPNASGKMEVEMRYQGEASLAAFLVENAGQVLDSREELRESK